MLILQIIFAFGLYTITAETGQFSWGLDLEKNLFKLCKYLLLVITNRKCVQYVIQLKIIQHYLNCFLFFIFYISYLFSSQSLTLIIYWWKKKNDMWVDSACYFRLDDVILDFSV